MWQIRVVSQFVKFRQFIWGSHNKILIQKLDLEDLVEDPPSFEELLLSMRKETVRRTEKMLTTLVM